MAQGKKTGGRQKGTPNSVTGVVRQAIQDADPNGFLIHVMKTGTIESVDHDTGEVTYEAVTALERIRAAQHLSRKITPDAKERVISFNVGVIDGPKSATDAIGAVVEALGNAQLTPSEASAVSAVIANYIKAFETHEIISRIEALEETAEQ